MQEETNAGDRGNRTGFLLRGTMDKISEEEGVGILMLLKGKTVGMDVSKGDERF